MSCFRFMTFRTLFVKLSSSRWSEHFARRLQQMIWSVRPPTALVSAPTSNTIVLCLFPLLLNTCLAEMQPSMPSLDPQAHLRLWPRQSNKLLQSVITPRMDSSGKTLAPISTSHNMARVYSARSRASRQALASVPKVDRMVHFDALLFQVMKDIGMISVLSRSSWFTTQTKAPC